jgi:hypothetical protein
MSNLLDTCLKVLGPEGIILPEDQVNFLIKTLTTLFPFTRWGTINWISVEDYIVLNSASDALLELQKRGKQVGGDTFIVWDEASQPVVKSDLITVVREIEVVTMVSFDTWILNPDEKYVIEFHHDNGIRLGFS